MNCKTTFKNIYLTVFVLCMMGLMLCPNHAAAFSLKNSDINHIVNSETNYKLNSLFMEVDAIKGYVVVGEIMIYLMDFRAGGKHYRTAFVNDRGDTKYADSVRASRWEGKRVIVTGYKLPSGDIVAKSIEKITDHHK
jgi:hypothetical protein